MFGANHCAYLLIIYYQHISNSIEFKNFTTTFNRTDISYSNWIKKRKAICRAIRLASAFKSSGNNDAQEKFTRYFSFANFIKLSDETRRKHTYNHCKECFSSHREHFLMLKKNNPTKFGEVPGTPNAALVQLLRQTPENLVTKADCIKLAKSVASKYDDLVSQTPHNITMSQVFKRKASTVKDVSSNVKRKIIQEARDDAKKSQLKQDFVALYSSTQSEKQWDEQRIDSHRSTRKSKTKSHIGKITSYKWNGSLLLDTLWEVKGKVNNWSQLARKINLHSAKNNGMQATYSMFQYI